MEKKKDMLEQHLAENFIELAKEEEQQINHIKNHGSEDDIRMPEGTKEAIRAKLDDEIEKIKEAEREEIYSRLSEEDRYALERGRKIIQEEKERAKANGAEEVPAEESAKKHIRKRHGRKPWKIYIAVAAVLVTMGAVGITAVGGPERMIVMMKSFVGDREVEQVDSSNENLVIVEEDEEEAYQKISEEFGVEPVKITNGPEDMRFDQMVYDEINQTAEMWYLAGDETVVYFINASYREASWGIDIEDKIVKSYKKKYENCEIEIKEYQIEKTETERFSAQFSYKGLEYFLIGNVREDKFELIIDNLYFIL